MNTQKILRVAHDMLGDGNGREWHDNPEYTRAVIEFVAETIPVPGEILDKGSFARDPFILGMIFAADLLAEPAACS